MVDPLIIGQYTDPNMEEGEIVDPKRPVVAHRLRPLHAPVVGETSA